MRRLRHTHHFIFGTLLSAALLLLLTPIVHAEDCGSISGTDQFGDSFVIPIEDCGNPFGASGNTDLTATLTLAGAEITDGAEVAIATSSAVTGVYGFSKTNNFILAPFELFRQVDTGYELLAAPINNNFTIDTLPAGTYAAVFTYSEAPFLNQRKNVWESLLAFFVPQPALANQFVLSEEEVLVWEFTVTESELLPPEPIGASSVLFLPGIQASRLYMEDDSGGENRLWEPNRNADVEKLAMDSGGNSLNSIYTKEVLDEVFGAKNIYKSLLDMLAELKADDAIADYEPFAYDWRYDVFTVATEPVQYQNGEQKLLLEEVKRLASSSHTGKVTIVAHSNGGLVAKALMSEYQDNELAGLVEKVIMVGTPQLGTPLAIGSLLHGIEQSKVFELLISQPTARNATQYMPGAYGLLPSKTYFANTTELIISSDESDVAAPVSSYGDLNDHDNFVNFLSDNSGTRNAVINITQPITLDETMVNSTVANQVILDSWVAPDDVQVFEVAGTGLTTISGFHYREFSCRDNTICTLDPFLKPMPQITSAGDKTVVFDSATAYQEDKIRFKVNLELESEGILNKDINHANITESDTVAAFLESALLYPQLTDTLVAEEFSTLTETYTIIGVHSPVSIVVSNAAGQQVGVVAGEIAEEISGSSYFEFAGSKYVIVPDDEDISVLLSGEEAGRYSLTIEALTPAGEQTLVQEIMGATSTPQMQASFGCAAGVCGELVVDYDDDGVLDISFDWSGAYENLNQEVEEITPEEAPSNASIGTRVRPPSTPTPQVAGISTSVPEAELKRMWAQVMEVQSILDHIEQMYLIK